MLSNHTYIIVSTELNSNLHQTIRNHSHYELELQLLTSEQRSSYIDMFFHSFNKVSLTKNEENMKIPVVIQTDSSTGTDISTCGQHGW